MWAWLRRKRRQRVLAVPFPEEWRTVLERDVALWRALPPESRGKLEGDLRIFLDESRWEGCGGLELTPEMMATVASQACVLTLGRSVDALSHVKSVLVYPEKYWAPDDYEDEAGVVTESVEDREGEAWERGTVILSWKEVRQDARRMDGRNLVLHEFAHQVDILDFLKGAIPAPGDRERYARWGGGFLEAYEAFCEVVDSGRRPRVLDEYGAEDEAEFFAVATEAFFERAPELKRHHGDLYGILSEYYNQDPASWPPTPLADLSSGPDGAAGGRNRKGKAGKRRRPG